MKPYYQQNGITIYQGDCLELMPQLESQSIDAIIADIPYGTTACKWDTVIPFAPMWKQLERICKGAIVFTASQPFTSALVMSNPYRFKHEWIWIKNRGSNFANTVREPMKEHESVLVFSYDKWTYNKQMQERSNSGKSRVNYDVVFNSHSDNYREFEKRIAKPVIQKDRGKYNSENYGTFKGKTITLGEQRVPSSWQKFNTEVGLHPTQKPVALMEYLIRTYTNEGDTVLDFTMGSGTTLLACKRTNRSCIGMEKELEYCQVAVERLTREML